MKTKLYKIFCFITLILPIFLLIGCENMGGGDNIHIAVVGNSATENFVVDGPQMYIDKINKEGGINGKKVVLDIFYDENNTAKAKQKALEIIEQKRAVAVIGHEWSSTSISAGEVYKKHGIPAISPAATNIKVTQDNEWYFRTVFNDTLQGQFLANYVKKILKHDNASIIFEEDLDFGKYLANIFEETSEKIELNIVNKWGFNTKSGNLEQRLKEISEELKSQGENAGAIFMAVHDSYGLSLVKHIKDMKINNTIIGPDSFTSVKFNTYFNTFPQEIENPGFYTNGIFVSTPLLYDTANDLAQNFLVEYQNKYQKKPDAFVPFAYDAIKLIIEAIQKTGVKGTESTIKKDRKKIRDYLANITKVKDAVKGLTGLNYFNEYGDSVKPISIGVYRNKNVISALGQLSPVRYLNLIPDLEEAVKQKRIILFGDQYMYTTSVAYTGIEVKSIESLDFEKSTCVLDFFLWIRFQGDIDADNIEFLNALEKIELPAPKEDEAKVPEPVEETVNDEKAEAEPAAVLIKEEKLHGLTSRLYHVKAKFKTGLSTGQQGISEYHSVGFQFRHRKLSRNNLIYVTDVLGMGLGGKLSFAERLKKDNTLSGEFGWTIDNVKFFQSTTPKGTMGDLKYLDIQNKFIDCSQFNFNVLLKADTFSLRRKMPVPFAIVLAGGSLALLIFLILIRRRVLSFKITWFLELLCLFCLLLSAEVVILSLISGTADALRYIRITIIAFDVLWWLAPAVWVQIGLDPFIWAAMRKQTGRPVPTVLRRFPAYIIYFIAGYGIVAFAFDQDITKLMATSGAVAMMIGLIVKDNIANYFASISLIQGYDLKIGNWVKIGDYEEGKIVEITKLATLLRTRGGTTISIPNNVIMGASIHNFDFPDDTYKLTFTFETVDSYSPDHVKRVTKDALLETECVLKEPEPIVFFEGQGDSSAIFTVLFTVRDYEKKGLHKSAAWRSVWVNLEKADIELATPNRIIHLADKDSDEEDLPAQTADKQPLTA